MGSIFGIRSAYEEVPHDVIQHHGNFEVRYYGERLVIESLLQDEQDSTAFRRLFKYLSGQNSMHKKIDMTIPVEVRVNDRCENRMSDPSTTDGSSKLTESLLKKSSGYIMRFTLPSKMKASEMPRPLTDEINAYETGEQVLATLRFSGPWSMERFEEQYENLLDEIALTEYRPIGQMICLTYDPPCTIPCLRRNEVAVEVNRVSNSV